MQNPSKLPTLLRRRPHLLFAGVAVVVAVIVVAVLIIVFSTKPANQNRQGYWHTSGSQILDAQESTCAYRRH